MKVPPDYKITPKILDLISKIDANLIFLSSLKISPKLKQKIQRISLLKSSLFSARIEGNPLKLENFEEKSWQDIQKKEVFNLIKANRYIEKAVKTNFQIDKDFIFNLHSLVMFGCLGKTRSFRKEIGAIFNQEGSVIYLSSPPTQINQLINQLIQYVKHSPSSRSGLLHKQGSQVQNPEPKAIHPWAYATWLSGSWVNSDKEKFPLMTALISHLIFEKIHPFIDGNGRVGRLLISAILKAKKYKNYFSVPFEEYLDNHRSDYYYFLDIGLKNTNDYLIFMLKAFLEETEKLKETINIEEEAKIPLLPPRQEEIYLIIKDQRLVSFDQIRRRFLKVPERTLRYDLKKLAEKKLIVKIGKTKGSYYQVKT